MSETNSAKGVDQKQIIIVAIIVLLIVGCGSFYGGIKYASAKKPVGTFGQGNFAGRGQNIDGANGMRNRIGAGQNGGFINGDILSLDDKSLTVKNRDGSSKIIFFSTSTEIGKFVSGALADLAIGQNVMVNGKANSDGSLVANSIQIRPAGLMPQGSPQTPGSNSSPVK